MENAYPGSNILVVTLTNEESKRIEAQSDEETKSEAMGVLRAMFGAHVPEASDILVPRWWNNRFQRGSYSFYPVHVDHHLLDRVKVLYYDNSSSDDNYKSLNQRSLIKYTLRIKSLKDFWYRHRSEGYFSQGNIQATSTMGTCTGATIQVRLIHVDD